MELIKMPSSPNSQPIDMTVTSSNSSVSPVSQPQLTASMSNQPAYTHGLGDALLPDNETKVCYHIDDQEIPFLIKLPFPSSSITLKDLKANLQLKRHFSHYKFYFKSHDKECGVVKEEIIDDNRFLPIFQGRVVAWVNIDCIESHKACFYKLYSFFLFFQLVTIEGSTFSDSSNSNCLTEISASDRLGSYQNGQQNVKRVACIGNEARGGQGYQ